jgi:hypothetical protein
MENVWFDFKVVKDLDHELLSGEPPKRLTFWAIKIQIGNDTSDNKKQPGMNADRLFCIQVVMRDCPLS